MDDPAIKERVKQLAATLKATGIAASEARAEEMARDIVATELKQLKNLDGKKDDPALNPQQRTGSTGKEQVAATVSGMDVPEDKPISELLAEDAASADEPAFPDPSPELGTTEAESMPEPEIDEPVARLAEGKPVVEEALDLTQETPDSEEDVSGTIPEEPAFPDPEPESEAAEPASEAPEPETQEPERKPDPDTPEAKVDLNKMFNFSKRQ